MSQLAIRFVFLNIYMFALFCPSAEIAVVRNQAKWPFFSFKKSAAVRPTQEPPAEKASKNENVASKISAKQNSFRSLLLWWPPTRLEVAKVVSTTDFSVRERFVQRHVPLPSPLELYEILRI